MGLHTSHNAYEGSCSSFNQWRRWLAKQAGFDIDDYWSGKIAYTVEMRTADYFPLLDHSDCDGKLSIEDCEKTLRFLSRAILPYLEIDNAIVDFVIRKNVSLCKKFIEGCLLAMKKQEPIVFS